MLGLKSHFDSNSSSCYLVCLPSSLLVHTSESHQCQGNMLLPSSCCCCVHLCKQLLCMPSPFLGLHIWVSSLPRQPIVSMPMAYVVAPMGCIASWLLAHGCVGKGHYHSLFMSEAHTSSCCCYATMPCSVLSWCKESWHCALMHSILHRVLSWLRYCCISMLHPSNRPWHCAHDSSSCLTQGVAPLFPSLGGESASCPVSLRSWVAHQHLSWSPCVVPTRLAQCALLVSEALHQGPLVWPCPSHHASPWVIYPFLKEHFGLF